LKKPRKPTIPEDVTEFFRKAEDLNENYKINNNKNDIYEFI